MRAADVKAPVAAGTRASVQLTDPGDAAPEAGPARLDPARLSLNPGTRRDARIYGGWWPRSRDATAELPGLIGELRARAGRVSRIALQAEAFTNIPRQLTADGRKVRIAWFRYMNPHTVIVTMAGADDLILLVVPEHASPAAATEALRLAASDRDAGSPEAILSASGTGAAPGPA
jgi:Family of unknown function (DUF5994)